jgi:hypothetical protein
LQRYVNVPEANAANRKSPLFACLMVFVLLVIACAETSSPEQKARATVALYLDLVNSHHGDEAWRRVYIDRVYHPHFRSLDELHSWNSIKETLPPVRGAILTTTAQVDKFYKGAESVDIGKPDGTVEDVYVARVKYQAVASISSRNDVVFPETETLYEYELLALDPADAGWKIIAQYPGPVESFMSASYYLAHPERYPHDEPFVVSLRAAMSRKP